MKKTLIIIWSIGIKNPFSQSGLVNRVRKISTDLIATYKGKFSTDFEHNKKVLGDVATIRSKGLKNEIAGYITSYLRREIEEEKDKESEKVAQTESFDETEEIEERILN